MMKQMRENTKIILWVVVVAFVITIFAVWGLDLQVGGNGQQQNLVGKVDGNPITPQLYQNAYNQLASQYRGSAPNGQLTYAQQEALHEQAWENIVNNMITQEQIEHLGITVTDDEVLSFLRSSPPPEVRQYFTNDKGEFDYAAYQAALNNPDADWTAVEQLARQRIPLLKLNQYLMSQVHVTEGELRRAFGEENTRMTVDYVRFPIDSEDVGDYEPSQEEIEAYYNSHPENYKLGERAVVRYVKIPLVASARDRDDISYTIEHIRSQLEFDDFETLAKTYSEAPTAEVGGDTGFLQRSQRDPMVMAAVDSLADGGVSQPIWTDKGVYLVQRVETKTDGGQTKYRLREIFLSLSAGAATSDSLQTVAQNVQRAAVNEGLEKAAAARELKVETTAPFVADVPIEGIGYLPSLSRYAFANDPGTISNVIGDGDNYYVCEIAERIPAGARPLEDVRETIRTALVLERRKQLAERKAEAFHRKLMTSPSDFREAAEQYGYAVGHADTFTVRQPVGDIPPRSAFGYAAYNLTVGAESPPVECNGSYYVIHVLDRTPFDDTAYQQQAEAVRSRLLQRKAQAYIDYWYQNLRDNAQIEDYRGAL